MMFQILIPKDNKEIKPLLVKLSAALAFSCAGYLLSRAHASRSSRPPPPSSENGCHFDAHFDAKGSKHHLHFTKPTPIEEDGFWTDEDECAKIEPDAAKAYRSCQREDCEEEVKSLRNMVRMLKDREMILEVQLLELYGLKEQEATMMELQNRLEINNMEAKLFRIKIETLQAENGRLEAEFAKVAGELETARGKIKILRKKLRYEAEQNKQQILALEKKVEDQKANIERLRELEEEADHLKTSNNQLKIENSDLARRLESTQILATSVLEDEEAEEVRKKNEELGKEIEQLQAERCSDVEELVYLRWINACLRHELRNFQAQPGKTAARDLSKTLSPKSEAKAKQLILEYANAQGMVGDIDSEWSSSQASLTADCEPDDNPHKAKFFTKLRRLITGKDRHRHHHHHTHATPMDAMQAGSDSDSPRYAASSSSMRIELKTCDRSLRLSSPFRTSSLDIQSSLNTEEDAKELSSDAGCVPLRESLSDLSEQDADLSQKSQLVKYAEALKGSSPR